MIQLIVNADDFGLTKGVNYGIIEAHVNGIVNSTTIMMNMPATNHAAALAKQHPSLGVGVHLVLTAGKPLHADVPSLTNEQGTFHSRASLPQQNIISEHVEREWKAQIEKCYDLGLQPTHLDSHHHVHMLPALWPVISKLSERYKLPVRRNKEKDGYLFSDIFLDDFYGDVQDDYFSRLTDRVPDGATVEVMCHPAFLDTRLQQCSSYTQNRLTELDILTKAVLPKGVELVSFS